MNKFKVGDRVVRIAESVDAGNLDFAQQYRTYTVKSLVNGDTEIRLEEVYSSSKIEHYVSEEVYNSPLFKALYEVDTEK